MTEIYLELAFLNQMVKSLIERAKEGDREQTWQLQQFTHKLLVDSNSDGSYGSDPFGMNNFLKSSNKLSTQKTAEALQFIHEMKAKELFHVIKLNTLYDSGHAMKYILQQKFQSNVGKKVTEIIIPRSYRCES
jgi:hypothetical protein